MPYSTRWAVILCAAHRSLVAVSAATGWVETQTRTASCQRRRVSLLVTRIAAGPSCAALSISHSFHPTKLRSRCGTGEARRCAHGGLHWREPRRLLSERGVLLLSGPSMRDMLLTAASTVLLQLPMRCEESAKIRRAVLPSGPEKPLAGST